MAGLIDIEGKPLRRESLREEQAKPDIVGVRTLLSDQQTTGLNPGKLARLMRDAEEGDAVAYLEMAEELEEKDTHYLSVISTRKRAVSQLDITVEPASDSEVDKANAELVERVLRRDELEGEIVDMLDAIGKGFSVTEMIWDTSGSEWYPKELKWRDPRWFEFSKQDGETLLLREGTGGVPLQPYKFIVHKHKSKSGLTIRGGVVRPCAWMWLFKNFSIKDWVIFAEAYGQPIRLGKYGQNTTPADKNILMQAVASIGSDAAAIIPESMKIEFIEAQGKTGTADVFERLAKFCDQQISKAVLGQTTTVDAISGGHAVSKEHNEVRADIEAADAKQLASTLNRQLVIPLIDINRGPQKAYPRLRIGRAEQIDAVKLSQTAESAQKMGIEISRSKMREKLNLPAPVDENDILVPLSIPSTVGTSEPPQTATASTQEPRAKDAIDDVTERLADRYEEIMNPMLSLLQSAADRVDSFDAFKQELLAIAGSEEMAKFGETLALASFMARLAGNHDIDIED